MIKKECTSKDKHFQNGQTGEFAKPKFQKKTHKVPYLSQKKYKRRKRKKMKILYKDEHNNLTISNIIRPIATPNGLIIDKPNGISDKS